MAEGENLSIPYLTVTLSLPKINDAGWIDPDVPGDWHELTPGTLDTGSEVFAAMTGGYAPKWSRFPDWEEMAGIAHQAADYYASRLGPTMTAANGALLDYESSSDSSLDIDGLPGHERVLRWCARFYPPAPVDRRKYAAHDGWPADITLCNVCHRPSRLCTCSARAVVRALWRERR